MVFIAELYCIIKGKRIIRFDIFQSLYRNQVKELKEEIEGKNTKLQDAQADLKSVDQEKLVILSNFQFTYFCTIVKHVNINYVNQSQN